MSVCFKPNGPFWTLCGYLKEPKVGKLDLLWFVLLPMKGFRVTWTFSGPHLVRWVISASGCVNWTPSRLPKREWFLPNFGLRLNFAIADYLFETYKFDNITGPGDEEVAEAGRKHFPHGKAQKFIVFWWLFFANSVLQLKILKKWCKNEPNQCKIYEFTNIQLSK